MPNGALLEDVLRAVTGRAKGQPERMEAWRVFSGGASEVNAGWANPLP